MNRCNVAISPRFDDIPQELKLVDRWVLFNDKKPFNPKLINKLASSTDPGTWGSFEEAQTAYEEKGYQGVGFVFNGDGIIGIDLDKCVYDGVPDPRALAILNELECGYVEISPSGTGLHGYGYSDEPLTRKKGILNGVNVEMYNTERFFTVTGEAIQNNGIKKLKNVSSLSSQLVSKENEHRITQENIGYTQDIHMNTQLSCVVLCTSITIPNNAIPTEVGERNRCIFNLARYLKSNNPEKSADDFIEVLKEWHQKYIDVIDTKEFLITLDDFERSWGKIRILIGQEVIPLLAEKSKKITIPRDIEEKYYLTGEVADLFKLCVALQIYHGVNSAFFLSCRAAAKVLGIKSHVKTNTIINQFTKRGILECTYSGHTGRASEFKFLIDISHFEGASKGLARGIKG